MVIYFYWLCYFYCYVSEVGFEVGGNSGINYLVLQVHYKDVSSFLPPSECRKTPKIRTLNLEL